MHIFFFSLFLLCAGTVCAADGGGRARKFAPAGDDPVLRELGEVKDPVLQERLLAAAEAFYGSRFDDAIALTGEILEEYPEAAFGEELYRFLLLMHGTALGFSGDCARAMPVLDGFMARVGDASGGGGTESDADSLCGAMNLRIDILEGCGDTAGALTEMDALLEKFGESTVPMVEWRVERVMERKAALLQEQGKREAAADAWREYLERLERKDGPDKTAHQARERAVRALEKLETESGG